VARGCAESNPREAVERKCEACLGDSSNTSSIPSLLVEQLPATSIRGSDVPLVTSFFGSLFAYFFSGSAFDKV